MSIWNERAIVRESVRAEREVIIVKLNQFMANAIALGHREEALAFETARNWLIRRQQGE